MNKLPLVSVLFTTYNGLPYIREAIRMILEQSYPNIEIVVVDDFSSDGTMEALQEEFGSLNSVILKVNKIKGRGKALNYGLFLCTGELIAINDADDFSTRERIEKQVEFLNQHPDYVLVGTYSDLRDLDTGKVESNSAHRPVTFEQIKDGFTKGQPIQHVTVMFRKEVALKAGGYNEKIKFLFDRDFFLRIAKYGRLHNLPLSLVQVGEHKNRFFKGNFVGLDRAWMNTKYQIQAILQFRLNYYLIPVTILKFIYSILLKKLKLS